ncbi:TetR/AcrR family transcriptional regulator [Comamonas aquatica]|uniref:TetR/AcrR family transcriptional regulator n=1 Tax=Comamonas aquatica TaxID=225991 RepID=UPI0028D8A77C|nr:TetR/AcrR family transcriptional regulator [Comamonas aquatica]
MTTKKIHTSSSARQGSKASQSEEPPGTRARILEAAVSSLIEHGSARTTTLEVQRRAGVSRGALLHHFPTHAALLASTISELIKRNEASVQESLEKLKGADDIVERAIRVLAIATTQPAYLAELELWAVARTDPELKTSLLEAERSARKESERVMHTLFSQGSDGAEKSPVVAMTVEFLRGLALSGVLRSSPVRRQQLISQWIGAARVIMEMQK